MEAEGKEVMPRKDYKLKYPKNGTLADIYTAVKGNKISKEEGEALNPKFNDSNMPSIQNQYSKQMRKTGGRHIAPLGDIHHAVLSGNITREEGMNLNPKYRNSNMTSIQVQSQKLSKIKGKPINRKAPPTNRVKEWEGEIWHD